MEYDYISTKTLINTVKSNEWWFKYDYNLNLYRGCSHGCIYCDSRSDCYGIEEFDRIKVKRNAIDLLKSELSRKRKKGIIGLGAMSDPYNQVERELQLTRQALEIFNIYGFGAAIFTKSNLVARDIDLLSAINKDKPVLCCITATTADDKLCARIEPYAPSTQDRMRAVRELSDAGLYVGIAMMPVLPYINDDINNMSAIINMAADSGAKFIYSMYGVTMRSNQRVHYYQAIDKIAPNLSEKYRTLYGDNYYCAIPNIKEMKDFFQQKCHEKGIIYDINKINDGYYCKKLIAEQLSFLHD